MNASRVPLFIEVPAPFLDLTQKVPIITDWKYIPSYSLLSSYLGQCLITLHCCLSKGRRLSANLQTIWQFQTDNKRSVPTINLAGGKVWLPSQELPAQLSCNALISTGCEFNVCDWSLFFTWHAELGGNQCFFWLFLNWGRIVFNHPLNV